MSARGIVALVALAVAVGAAPASAYSPQTPPQKALYSDGPAGRYLLNGKWLFRADPADRGVDGRWYADSSTAGWRGVTVPNVWNIRPPSVASMNGEPVWYRDDFVVPDDRPDLTWIAHFDSVNYRATVWLNGQLVGSHTGSYVPFELPLASVRPGVNHLVVRVDNRLLPTDFPPSHFTPSDMPHEGWWNYGGITRGVYLRRVDRVDISQVQVRPQLPCPTCAATVGYSVTVTNYSPAAQDVRLTGAYGSLPVALGEATIPPGGSQVFSATLPVASPHLWSPSDPYLYTATLDATIGGDSAPAAHYTLLSGIRSIALSSDGRLLLNGRHLDFRGVAIHEDSLARGAALTTADRDRIFAWTRQLGATEIRAHYPLDPYMYEQADRLGILMWSEIPVYRMLSEFLRIPSVQAAATDLLRANIVANQNHPSVIVWSVGNELNQTAPDVEQRYVASATAAAKALDATRPVAISVAGVPGAGCGAAYAPLDVLGLNDYYGWYSGSIASESRLSPFLDSVRACEPHKAVVVTETGAEANRSGSAREKGTYGFQQAFVRYHFGVYARKSWLSGATYFTLQEFRVRPDWSGGNPRPDPPLHQKGLISFTGALKPAFATLARIYHRTQQYPAP